jgi:hypothetical protein
VAINTIRFLQLGKRLQRYRFRRNESATFMPVKQSIAKTGSDQPVIRNGVNDQPIKYGMIIAPSLTNSFGL